MSSLSNDHRPSVSASLYSRLMASEAALPEVYTTAEPPFVITFANSAWERLCGWKNEAAIGRTCAILQGERTCKRTLGQISEAAAAGLPIEVVLINYTKKGAPFTNQLSLEPLCLGPTSPGRITHYVGTLRASPAAPAAVPSEPLSAHFQCMGMGGAPSTVSAPATSAQTQSLACRRLVEDLLAANGDAPVSLPQLLNAMACLLPVEMGTALKELTGAVLRNEIKLNLAEFEGAVRILLGGKIGILSDLVGWLTLLAPEMAGAQALSDAETASACQSDVDTAFLSDEESDRRSMDWAPSSPHSLDSPEPVSPVLAAATVAHHRRAPSPVDDVLDGGAPVGRGSVDDIMTPDLDLPPIDQHFLNAKT